jgi:hypothetical protein
MGNGYFTGAVLFSWVVILSAAFIVSRIPKMSEFARFTWTQVVLFGGVIATFNWFSVSLAPMPNRYELEADVAISFAAIEILWLLPRRLGLVVAIVAVPAAAYQAVNVEGFNKTFLRSVNIYGSPEYKCAIWLKEHFPGQRAMVSGDAEFWFNYFNPSPQLSGSHEPFSPNRSQQIGVFIIYSGLNARDRDATISELWLKAYGVIAVTVPGPRSSEPIHPFVNAKKFDGVLPLLTTFNGDNIYAVPQRSASLAHVVRGEDVVAVVPKHGLDVDRIKRYVDALNNPALPTAEIRWDGTDAADITATVRPDEVISVQESYYPGWTAVCDGRSQDIEEDGLGLIVVKPRCHAHSQVHLRFKDTLGHRILEMVSALALVALAAGSWLQSLPAPRRVN